MRHHGYVGEFHQKFGLDNTSYKKPGPRELPADLIEFRLKFLVEELKEIATGLGYTVGIHLERKKNEIDIVAVADGLVDLEYVDIGFAHLLGLPWNDLWLEVQRANMTKQRAEKAEDSDRGGTWDVIKPEGWRPPNILGVLKRYGWKL